MTAIESNNEIPLGRLSEDDYASEFGTPTSGADHHQVPEAEAVNSAWLFSQLAKQYARHVKTKIKSRVEYRMAANTKVSDAFQTLNLQKSMTDAEFHLLRQAIQNFNVRINVHDNLSLDDLRIMHAECDVKWTTSTSTSTSTSEPTALAEKLDLDYWWRTLSAEIRRVQMSRPAGVPSQHVEIMRSSGTTLRNILSPETIRRKFVSLDALTKTIRNELVDFLTAGARQNDRAAVIDQIKTCIRSRNSNL